MYTINLDGIISEWGISASFIEEELRNAAGQDVKIFVKSPGGNVFEGIGIFNAIKNYKEKTTAVISSSAASIASYIVMACDEIVMEANAFLMIHNPHLSVEGDYISLEKHAAILKDITDVMAEEYSSRCGEDVEHVRDMMASETWMNGAVAKEKGFVDGVLPHKGTNTQDIAAMQIAAKANFKTLKAEIFSNKKPEVVTQAESVENRVINKEPKKGEKSMNLQELKAAHPDLVETIRTEGRKDELERVKAHLKFLISAYE